MSPGWVRRVRGAAMVALSVVATALGVVVASGVAGATTLAPVNGQGSTYAALAFQQWTESVQNQGLNVNYTATGSPAGLQAYSANTANFAGTEAEYSELYADTPGGTPNDKVARGFAYTPDVAGAVAIMYHVALNTTGSDQVNYLHLSRLTVAKIFLGVITNWDSPTITNDNKGLVLPNEPISLDYRTGQSGTTALFYDFVKNTDPSDYPAWAQKCGFPTSDRIWEIDDSQTCAFLHTNHAEGFSGSTQQAQFVSSPGGLWSIGYDEFGYAKVYHDNVAWIENASGTWVQPYAVNIAAALQTAVLAPTTSQTLKGVYASTDPLTYPISAYSYILYQCAPTPTRPTCKSPYSSTGVMNTMAKFMQYVACTGQIKMATIGYSPLPTQLSQFLANAISYMTGQPAEQLTAQNCANPQFQGGKLGAGAAPPPDPTANVSSLAPTAGTASAGGSAATSATSSGKGTSKSAGTTTTTSAGLAGTGSAAAAAGTSTGALNPSPVAYVGPPPAPSSAWPFLALVLLLAIPVALLTVGGRRRRAARSTSEAGEGSGSDHSLNGRGRP